MRAEITRVRESILQQQIVNREPLTLPEPVGPVVSLSEKLYIPVKDHPEVYNVHAYKPFRFLFWTVVWQYSDCYPAAVAATKLTEMRL